MDAVYKPDDPSIIRDRCTGVQVYRILRDSTPKHFREERKPKVCSEAWGKLDAY